MYFHCKAFELIQIWSTICTTNGLISESFNSMNIGKSSQLGKHGFGSLHNLRWTCYLNEDILLRDRLCFTNKVDQISLNSLLWSNNSKLHIVLWYLIRDRNFSSSVCEWLPRKQASCHRSEHHGAEDSAEEDETGERRKRALDDQEIRNTVSSPSLKIHRRPDKNKEEDNESRMEDKDYYDPGRSKISIFNCRMLVIVVLFFWEIKFIFKYFPPEPIQRGGPKETDSDDDDRYYIDIRERGRGQEPEKEDKDWMHVGMFSMKNSFWNFMAFESLSGSNPYYANKFHFNSMKSKKIYPSVLWGYTHRILLQKIRERDLHMVIQLPRTLSIHFSIDCGVESHGCDPLSSRHLHLSRGETNLSASFFSSSWHQSTTPSQKELEYIDLTQGNQQSPPTVGYLYSPHWASPYGPGKPPKMEKY